MIWIQILGRPCNAGCMVATATAGCGLGTALLQGRLAQHSHAGIYRCFAAEQSVLMGWQKLLQWFGGLNVWGELLKGKIITANSFICFVFPCSLHMVGHKLPRSLTLYFVPICPESANALMKDRTLCHPPSSGNDDISHGILLFLFLLKAEDRNPHIMILLKYIFNYILDPVFSPNLTRAYSTKVGSFTKITFLMGKNHTG